MNYKPTWSQTWFTICYLIAMRSDDPDTHSGCVIVPDDNSVPILGYNGLPRGVEPSPEKLDRAQEKYIWMEHAERNALYNAARRGVPMEKCTLYVNWTPCTDCARAIVQAGIKKVMIHKEGQLLYDRISHNKWKETQDLSLKIMEQGNVEVELSSVSLPHLSISLNKGVYTLDDLNAT